MYGYEFSENFISMLSQCFCMLIYILILHSFIKGNFHRQLSLDNVAPLNIITISILSLVQQKYYLLQDRFSLGMGFYLELASGKFLTNHLV